MPPNSPAPAGPAPTGSPLSDSPGDAPEAHRQLAADGFRYYQAGCATGDWTGLLGVLADRVIVHMPYPAPYGGRQAGRAAAARVFAFPADVMRLRAAVEPRTVAWAGDTVGFEVTATGTTAEGPVAGRPIAVFFDLGPDAILGVREYLGGA